MYLYFDRVGKLKEIINDEALRQGNYNVNKMYVYVDRNDVSSIDVSYLLPSGLIVGPENITKKTTAEIPFDRKRDLLYFKYYKEYTFVEIDLSKQDLNDHTALEEAGLVHCSLIAILNNSSQLALGDVNFNVEVDEVLNQHYVASQEYLSLSDYQFLRSLIDIVTVNNDLTCDKDIFNSDVKILKYRSNNMENYKYYYLYQSNAARKIYINYDMQEEAERIVENILTVNDSGITYSRSIYGNEIIDGTSLTNTSTIGDLVNLVGEGTKLVKFPETWNGAMGGYTLGICSVHIGNTYSNYYSVCIENSWGRYYGVENTDTVIYGNLERIKKDIQVEANVDTTGQTVYKLDNLKIANVGGTTLYYSNVLYHNVVEFTINDGYNDYYIKFELYSKTDITSINTLEGLYNYLANSESDNVYTKFNISTYPNFPFNTSAEFKNIAYIRFGTTYSGGDFVRSVSYKYYNESESSEVTISLSTSITITNNVVY